MSRVSIAERTNLSMFLVRGVLRRLFSRLHRHSLFGWRMSISRTDRLVIAPQDLRTADATLASEIYGGRFAFAGKVVICDARSPFEMTPPSEDWAIALHGFGWLRHLRAAESGITRANARALVDEWISLDGANDPIAWRPEVVARRVISWLSQASMILQDADVVFYRRFLRSMARQVRYLRRTVNDARGGVPRLQALIALIAAALCMAGQMRYLRQRTNRLVEEINIQILPDGGHISRNPDALIELLADMLPLRQAYSARNVAPPPALLNAIDRMMPMLRFFRHGDGTFALFNGMGSTPTDLITTILAYDDTRGAPLSNAPHSGYQRIEAGDTVLLVDCGKAPPMAASVNAHAGCLSFELSRKFCRIVINCGLPAVGTDGWRQVARATAAHSTVTFNDASSAHFVESGPLARLMHGAPMVGGPKVVTVTREDADDYTILRTSHDGYAERFGVVHERILRMAHDGSQLDGEDSFRPAADGALPKGGPDEFAIRFHLHPAVKANRLTDGHGVMLVLPDRTAWTFNAYEDQVDLEESVYLAGADGPRRTVQIVIHGRARKDARVQWTFTYQAPGGGQRRNVGEEPELPL